MRRGEGVQLTRFANGEGINITMVVIVTVIMILNIIIEIIILRTISSIKNNKMIIRTTKIV